VILTISVVCVVCIVIVFFLFLQPRFAIRWLADQSPEVLYFVDTKTKAVALTIDDAPNPIVTPQLLNVLNEYSARATFFLIGENIKGNEHLLERMRMEGHELGNHLATDSASIFLSPDEFERQLLEVDNMIGVSGPQKWFRPGSGFYNARMIKQAKAYGYRCSLGCIYPHDTLIRNISIITTFITKKVFPGAIIVMHDGKVARITSVEVLRRVLPELRERGYEVVTLSELISVGEKLPAS
jgi:peptidoglycan/xylan/chitin deacetylase (PgdA/CDA1 family)